MAVFVTLTTKMHSIAIYNFRIKT